MALPVVTIVGRPNVGKSSLLNAMARQMISIVDPTAGVTRDRISTLIETDSTRFELVDTGGYGITDSDDLTEHVESQIALALDRADMVLFVVDLTEGITPLDTTMAQLLRKRNLNVLLVANKTDSPKQEYLAGEFVRLGFGTPLCVSALHGRGREDLLATIADRIAHLESDAQSEAVMKLAVVGKRNAGKSTFINALAGEQRVIVSEIPGTTRDSVDVRFEKDGRTFIAIDTAGVRKKSRIVRQDIEFYSYHRAIRSIRRADVVLLFIDAAVEISQVDKKLARTITDLRKPCVIVINKWDLVRDKATSEAFGEYLDATLPGLNYAPISFITAVTGKNIDSLVDLAAQLYKQSRTQLPTAKLNAVLRHIVDSRPPSARRKVGIPKLYYGTQIATAPPTLMLFVNDPEKFDENYQRFLLNQLREQLPFGEVPIRLLLRSHHEE